MRRFAHHLCYSIASSSKRSPANYATILTNRTGLLVEGKDSTTFLQGLITNDIRKLETQPLLPALILSPNGRVQFDLLIGKSRASSSVPSYLLECSETDQQRLQKTLERYRLRSKITIQPFPLRVSSIRTDESLSSKINQEIWHPDPRLPSLNLRGWSSKDDKEFGLPSGIKLVDMSVYEFERIIIGVPQGPEELIPGEPLPLEYNFDLLNYISFQKGCYIGQELTARTHHTGVVRKRLFPFMVPPNSTMEEIEKGAVISSADEDKQATSSRRREIGRIVYLNKDLQVGFALIRLEHLDCELQVGQTPIELHKPHWFPNF